MRGGGLIFIRWTLNRGGVLYTEGGGTILGS